MLEFLNSGMSLSDDITRRAWLRMGSLGTVGLGGISGFKPSTAKAESSIEQPPRRAKSVILFWLSGGVPQHDTWDPKPEGPEAARTPFGVIETKTPGLHVGALMPKTAQLTDRIAVIRSMHTGDNSHSSSGYQMFTGIPHIPLSQENAIPRAPNLWPSASAIVRHQIPDENGLPSAITLPRRIANVGEIVWPGQDAGFLGRKYDPWLITCDPSDPKFKIPNLSLPQEVSQLRLKRRLSLLDQVNAHIDSLEDHASAGEYSSKAEQAVSLLSGVRARRAFDLSLESEETRQRYGTSKFGQSVLLARRLVEAGTSFVQVNWQRIPGKENNGGWDTHIKHNESLKGWLMPMMDQTYSALLLDLEERGLLDDTLVVWAGEFGHTPRISARLGRDHWGNAFSIALAGGGIRGGTVLGATDNQAGHVISDRVLPRDYIATLLHCLGIAPETTIQDPQDRPMPLSRGRVIEEILA